MERLFASSWLIYLKCMMIHGLANFKFTLDKFVRAVVLKIMMPVCDARAIFVGFMVNKLKLEYIYS